MAHVGGAGRLLREPPDRDDEPGADNGVEESGGRFDFGTRRPPVRVRAARLVRMGRDDVPEQNLVLDPEADERALDDRRRCLAWSAAGQLALGGERDPRDARAPVAGGFPDQDDGSIAPIFEVGGQPLSKQGRMAILIERTADRGLSELGYQRSQRTTSSTGRRRARRRSFSSSCIGSGAGWPMVTTPTISKSSWMPSSSRRRSLFSGG
jgi:hypothetical protein